VPSSKKGPASRPKTTNTSNARLTGGASAGTPAKGAVSKPLSTTSTTSKPLTAKTPVGAKPSLSAKTPASGGARPISTKKPSVAVTRRQARLARQAQLQRQRQLITAGIIAVLVIAVALIGFQFLPKSKPAAAKPTTYGLLSDLTPGAKGNIHAVGTPITQSDGLKYVDVKVGTGQAVKATDTVTVNYTGWLTDGTKFDSSADHNPPGPTQFPLSGVIKGWSEGLIGMKIGGERRLLIPASLGYGASGQPPTIPGNATLIFDVTLVSIP
jgi:hypothetical protein